MSGCFAEKSPVSFCIRIMSPLFTVAIVSVVYASASDVVANSAAAKAALARSINMVRFLPC